MRCGELLDSEGAGQGYLMTGMSQSFMKQAATLTDENQP
jgi:hypothetical protein